MFDNVNIIFPKMFKDAFKYYKSKNPPPELDKVYDFDKIDKTSKVKKLAITGNRDFRNCCGIRAPETWDVHEFTEHPGLIFIRNPFTRTGQRYWIIRCLRDYSKKPNKTNLDPFNSVPEGKDWWNVCQNNKFLLNKLRWATLGYHHDWDTKVYSEDNKGEFPGDLAELSRHIAQHVGYPQFRAEAAIVNYYHLDSTLSGHTDHSEENLEAPLLSFSFGQTAIFLLGGRTKEEKPSAILLRSGDVVVMSKESRLCYHGIPKILQSVSRSWDCHDGSENCLLNPEFKNVVNICREEVLWKPFGDYLSNCRINVNVRQVLKKNQKRLHDGCIEKT